MKQMLQKIWSEDEGVLSFEWVLLVTLLTIGIVSGVAATRDAIIDELADVSEAALSIDQSYVLTAFEIDLDGDMMPDIEVAGSTYTDDGFVFEDCDRVVAPLSQLPQDDIDS